MSNYFGDCVMREDYNHLREHADLQKMCETYLGKEGPV